MCEFQSWHRLETSGRCSEVNWKMLFPTLYCQIEKNTVQGTFLLTSLQQCITVHWSLQIFAVQYDLQCSALHTVQCNAQCGAKCKMQCGAISKAVQCKKQNVKCSPVCTAGTSADRHAVLAAYICSTFCQTLCPVKTTMKVGLYLVLLNLHTTLEQCTNSACPMIIDHAKFKLLFFRLCSSLPALPALPLPG